LLRHRRGVFTKWCVLVEGVGVCDVTSRVHRVHATPTSCYAIHVTITSMLKVGDQHFSLTLQQQSVVWLLHLRLVFRRSLVQITGTAGVLNKFLDDFCTTTSVICCSLSARSLLTGSHCTVIPTFVFVLLHFYSPSDSLQFHTCSFINFLEGLIKDYLTSF
jgi:hypothetical protein